MAEEHKKENKKAEKKQEKELAKEAAKKKHAEEENYETLVRVMGYDLPGSKNIFSALTRIKGISWTISNAVCLKLNYPRSKKVSELTKQEIEKIESFLKELPIPDYLKNRRSDPETGKTGHNYGADLDIIREFDIKRLKKMKSYKGIRHSFKLPVRGQRTRSHFRVKASASGVKAKKKVIEPVATTGVKNDKKK